MTMHALTSAVVTRGRQLILLRELFSHIPYILLTWHFQTFTILALKIHLKGQLFKDEYGPKSAVKTWLKQKRAAPGNVQVDGYALN